MTIIEIISINSKGLNSNKSKFNSLLLIEEQKIESYGILFNNFIRKFYGTIIHLGEKNTNIEDNNLYTEKIIILDIEYDQNFKFENKYLSEIEQLIEDLIKSSPTNEIIFLTENKSFELNKIKFKRFLKVDQFWEEHKKKGLQLNTAYLINVRQKLDLKTEIELILWNNWDPIGVNDSNIYDDEYKNYVPEIIKLLNNNADINKISNYLNNIIKFSIGLNQDFSKHNNEIAKKLLSLKMKN